MPTDVIPDTHRDLLDAKGFAHLASTGPEGHPQSHPVWYDFRDGQLEVSTTKTRQKYRNVRRDPHVAVSILDPDNPYRYLEVRGRVVDFVDDPDKTMIDHLAQKYLGKEEYPQKDPAAERVTLVIEPDHAATMG
jgi:PPOX class probable F420-dependent enzyme